MNENQVTDIPKKKTKPKNPENEASFEELLKSIVSKANDKDYGGKVSCRKVQYYALKKLTEKDIEILKEESMDSEDLMKKEHKEYIRKSGRDILLWDYIYQKNKGKLH